MIAVMDCSFIAKSGKKTFGLDQFYNGSHNRVEKGLEVSLVAVVDVETEVGFGLLAEQTFDQGFCPDLTRMDYYFIFRDAKQNTCLSDCQARDVKKLDFHVKLAGQNLLPGRLYFNVSFTALNLAKLDAYQQQLGLKPFVFSMASVKRRALNDHLLDMFISKLGLSPTLIKSHANYQSLRAYGVIAA